MQWIQWIVASWLCFVGSAKCVRARELCDLKRAKCEESCEFRYFFFSLYFFFRKFMAHIFSVVCFLHSPSSSDERTEGPNRNKKNRTIFVPRNSTLIFFALVRSSANIQLVTNMRYCSCMWIFSNSDLYQTRIIITDSQAHTHPQTNEIITILNTFYTLFIVVDLFVGPFLNWIFFWLLNRRDLVIVFTAYVVEALHLSPSLRLCDWFYRVAKNLSFSLLLAYLRYLLTQLVDMHLTSIFGLLAPCVFIQFMQLLIHSSYFKVIRTHF